MGVLDKEIAAEIIRLEELQALGHNEYEVTETVTHIKPIAPRLRELYKQLHATGLGPVHTGLPPDGGE